MTIDDHIQAAVRAGLREELRAALQELLPEVLPEVVRRAAEPEHLPRKEAAKFIGVSERKLDYLLENRKLPKVKRGRRVLVPTKALRQYLDEAAIPARREQ